MLSSHDAEKHWKIYELDFLLKKDFIDLSCKKVRPKKIAVKTKKTPKVKINPRKGLIDSQPKVLRKPKRGEKLRIGKIKLADVYKDYLKRSKYELKGFSSSYSNFRRVKKKEVKIYEEFSVEDFVAQQILEWRTKLFKEKELVGIRSRFELSPPGNNQQQEGGMRIEIMLTN